MPRVWGGELWEERTRAGMLLLETVAAYASSQISVANQPGSQSGSQWGVPGINLCKCSCASSSLVLCWLAKRSTQPKQSPTGSATSRQILREREREREMRPGGRQSGIILEFWIWFSFCHFAFRFRLSCVFDWPKKRQRQSRGREFREMRPTWSRFNFNFIELCHCQLCSSLLRKGISNEAAAAPAKRISLCIFWKRDSFVMCNKIRRNMRSLYRAEEAAEQAGKCIRKTFC